MELIWVAVFLFAFCVGLAVFIYHLPPERFRKRKRPVVPAPEKKVDWEGIAKRWEKNNATLNGEIDALKKERKTFTDQIEADKKVIHDQLEQLAREKAWREKEEQMVAKVKNTDHELKDELRKTQQQLDQEHTIKLKVDIELQETKILVGRLKEEVRALTVKTLALEKEAFTANKEIKDLKNTNAELKKQKEDVKWIAKSDYDAVVIKWKKAESELGRLLRDQQNQQGAQQPEPLASPWVKSPAAPAEPAVSAESVPKEIPVSETVPAEVTPSENQQPQAPVEEATVNNDPAPPTAPIESVAQDIPQPTADVVEAAQKENAVVHEAVVEIAPENPEPVKPVEVTPSPSPETQAPAAENPSVNIESQAAPIEVSPVTPESQAAPEQTQQPSGETLAETVAEESKDQQPEQTEAVEGAQSETPKLQPDVVENVQPNEPAAPAEAVEPLKDNAGDQAKVGDASNENVEPQTKPAEDSQKDNPAPLAEEEDPKKNPGP